MFNISNIQCGGSASWPQALNVIPYGQPTLEGVLREELAGQDGKRLDLVRYALLCDDWLKGAARRRLVRLAPLTVESA